MPLSFLGCADFHYFSNLFFIVCQVFLFVLKKSWQLLFCQNMIHFLEVFKFVAIALPVAFIIFFSDPCWVLGYVPFLISYITFPIGSSSFCNYVQKTCYKNIFIFIIYIHFMGFSFYIYNLYYILLFYFELCSFITQAFILINVHLDIAFCCVPKVFV